MFFPSLDKLGFREKISLEKPNKLWRNSRNMSTEKGRGKRQELRAQRRKRARLQRLLIVLGIVLVIGSIAFMLVYDNIRQATAPIGDFTQITPTPRPMAAGTAVGDPNAPVRIDVFSDFQCVACVQFAQRVEPEVVEKLVAGGDVYMVFRHFPIIDQRATGQESRQAANASMCAAEQDRFWDYHDILTANFQAPNQGFFRDRRLLAFAESLGLDMNQFESCFEANRFRSQIDADYQEGVRLGISGTPSVFVNGQQIAPGFVPSYDQIEEAVQAALSQN
jgi:protein-disulfide isomerase